MSSKWSCKEAVSMRRKAIKALCILLLFSFYPALARAGTPDWLRALVQAPQKKYADDVNAVGLLTETETTVKDIGQTITRARTVLRVLRPHGPATASPS